MHTRLVSISNLRLGLNVILTLFFDFALTTPLWLSNLKHSLRIYCTLVALAESWSLEVCIIFSSRYKLQLLLLVMTTLRVFVKPTVIVPKSSFEGLISIKPSLPAPMIVIDLLLVAMVEAKADYLSALAKLRPDPGEKKPTLLFIWSKRFRVKIGMLIWYSFFFKGVKQATS